MYYDPVCWTDQGQRRPANQDSVLIGVAGTDYGQAALTVICDGMGGLAKGELASRQVVEHFHQWFENRLADVLYGGETENVVRREMEKILHDENEALMRYASGQRIRLGTTATALLLYGGRFYLTHVGDSRCYLIRQGQPRLLTDDDTLVMDQVRNGHLSEQEAARSSRRNILTACVGVYKDPEFHYYTGQASDGDGFLVCTDGFWHLASDADLREISLAADPLRALKETMAALRGRGEGDNITAAWVRLSEVKHEADMGEEKEIRGEKEDTALP